MNPDTLLVLYKNRPTTLWGELSDAIKHIEEMMDLSGWDSKETAAAAQSVVRLIEGAVEATSYSLTR